jgi:hypothetical protein
MRRSMFAPGWTKCAHYLTASTSFLRLMQCQCAFGQVDEGAITATVSDPTGAVTPNAQATPTNTDDPTSFRRYLYTEPASTRPMRERTRRGPKSVITSATHYRSR